MIDWSRWIITALLLGLFAAVGGAVIMLSGLMSIKASAGHWAITEALLQFGKRRSVATHALGTKVPELDDMSKVLRGAGHYEIGCRPCHGAPDLPQPPIAQAMLPRPPYLAESVHRYEPAELFQIVKHGIKLTGMPAWLSQRRDDEVWAMVAFLRRVPGMTAAEYERLSHGAIEPADVRVPMEDLASDSDVARTVTENCSRCHGIDGMGRGAGAFPRLAGQHVEYLYASLVAYAAGDRHSGIMHPIALGLDPRQLRAIAEYYAALQPQRTGAASAAPDTADGQRIATHGLPEEDIPACISCHGPGQPRPNRHYPMLAGQYEEYLRLQLELLKNDNRGGTAYHDVMHEIAYRLSPQQVEAVARYFASLPWAGAAHHD